MTLLERSQHGLRRLAYPLALVLTLAWSWLALRWGAAPALVPALATALGALLVLGLERALPFSRSWRGFQGDSPLDWKLAALALLVPLAHRALVDAGLVWLAGAPLGLELWPSAWPLLAQGALALLVADLGAWLAHRLVHAHPALWRLHAVHHSAPRLYWLNTWRFHPVDLWLIHAASMTPLLVLGASPEALALYAAVASVHGLLQHGNLAIEHPRLGWLLSTPDQHRWHHDAQSPQAVNYGALLSLWDRLAGTWRRGGAPSRVGLAQSAPTPRLAPRWAQAVAHRARSVSRGLWCAARHLALLIWESGAVVLFMKVLPHGLIEPQHPWASGQRPGQGRPLWEDNLVYRSPSRLGATVRSDQEIIHKVGRFLARMVQRSASEQPEKPQGPQRRMPHAVNYIHGSVHCNGVFLLFDDIPDLLAHLTDRRFRRELLRFGRQERREVTLVLRTRQVDPEQYAWCVGCARGYLPWFSNGNAPLKTPVLWGNPAPYPVLNLINGAWMDDLWALWTQGSQAVVRPAPPREGWFEGHYGAGRRHSTWGDRLLAWLMFLDVRARGFKGQLVFTHRRRIEPHRQEEYRQRGGYWRWYACQHVSHPFGRRKEDLA